MAQRLSELVAVQAIYEAEYARNDSMAESRKGEISCMQEAL